MLGGTMRSKAQEDPLVSKAILDLWAGLYLAKTKASHPLANPLYAELRGLAPLLIQVGSAETLLDDSVRLAANASAQEVSVRLEAWPEMLHVWHMFHPILGDARRALAIAGAFIQERMQGK